MNKSLPDLEVQDNLPFVHVFSVHLDTVDPEGLNRKWLILKQLWQKQQQNHRTSQHGTELKRTRPGVW